MLKLLPKKQAKTPPADTKLINFLQDLSREDFINPFEELARMKLQVQKLLKELQKERN